MKNLPKLKIAITAAGILGLCISLFMWYEYTQPLPLGGCVLQTAGGANSCEVVRNSDFSTLLGIQIPIWGTLYFVGMLGLMAWEFSGRFPWGFKRELLLLGAGWGLLFELYMTALQAFIIQALCSWCLMILGTVSVLFLLTLTYYRRSQKL